MKNHRWHIVSKISMLIVMCLLSADLFSQTSVLTARIVERSSGEAISYANLSLECDLDSTLFFGGISDKNGKIEVEEVPFGQYSVKVSFIGFETQVVDKVVVRESTTNIGTIKLDFVAENIDQVTVKGHRNGINYAVDRKVIDAKSFPGADVAMDLLENIPSVQVDFEGNLTYRGDGTFKVFINGHQVKNGEEKLRQLSAEKIDYVEVITNPSAKFDAEGTAGIIQVILKRNRLEGFVLSSSAKASTIGSYEWQFSIDQKGERGGWYLEGLIDDRIQGKADVMERMTLLDNDEWFETLSDLQREKNTVNSYLELGFNYDLTEKDYIDFTINGDPIRRSENDKMQGLVTESTYTAENLIQEENYFYDSYSEMTFRYLGTTLSYEHAFTKNRDHLLSAYIDFSSYIHPLKEKKVDSKNYTDRVERLGYTGQEDNEMVLTANLAYENKLGENTSFEFGAQAELDHIPEISSISGSIDESGNIVPFPDEPKNQKVDFKQDVYSAYLTYKSSLNFFEYRIGIRTEYTDRKSNYSYLEDGSPIVNIAETNFIDFFPSVHGLFNFSKESQLAVNYTRRINRPDYWSLVPLKQYFDPYRYYQGNGKLMPSYVNAFELGYKKSWENSFVGGEVFVRNTTDVIQSYLRVSDAEKIIWTKENVGDSWSFGTELMTSFDVFDWWNANIATSLYQYILQVDLNNKTNTEKQFRSDSRINNTVYLGNTLTFKFDVLYRSPHVSVQSTRDAYWYSNMALKKTFNDNKWQILLSWSDVFNTLKYSRNSEDDRFSLVYDYDKVSFASVKITYTLDNQK